VYGAKEKEVTVYVGGGITVKSNAQEELMRLLIPNNNEFITQLIYSAFQFNLVNKHHIHVKLAITLSSRTFQRLRCRYRGRYSFAILRLWNYPGNYTRATVVLLFKERSTTYCYFAGSRNAPLTIGFAVATHIFLL
jgi:hypothetical protein